MIVLDPRLPCESAPKLEKHLDAGFGWSWLPPDSEATVLFMHDGLSLFACMSGIGFRCFLSSCFFSLHVSFPVVGSESGIDGQCCLLSWLEDSQFWHTMREGGTESPEDFEVRVKKPRNHRGKPPRIFSLLQNKLLIRIPLFCQTFPATSENSFWFRVIGQGHSQWFICFWTCSLGHTSGHRKKAMQRGISLEELLGIYGYLMHLGMWLCAGTGPLSSCLFYSCL